MRLAIIVLSFTLAACAGDVYITDSTIVTTLTKAATEAASSVATEDVVIDTSGAR